MSMNDVSTTSTAATVDVVSAWKSKINWTQVVAGVAMALSYFTGGKVGLTVEQQLALVTVIGLLSNVVTWIVKTWFTKSVTPAAITNVPGGIPKLVVFLALALPVTLMLSACGDIRMIAIPTGLPGAGTLIPIPGPIVSPISNAKLSRKGVVVGAMSFDTAEQAATEYIGLPRCPKATVCRDPGVTKSLIKYVRQGASIRKQIVQFAIDHPGQLGDQGLQDSLNIVAANIMALLK